MSICSTLNFFVFLFTLIQVETLYGKTITGINPYSSPFILNASESHIWSELTLTMLPSGDLSLTRGGIILWHSNTAGQGNCSAANAKCYATLQSDGNLVLYSGATSYWSSNTAGQSGNILKLSGTQPYISLLNQGIIKWSNLNCTTDQMSKILSAPAERMYGIKCVPIFTGAEVVNALLNIQGSLLSGQTFDCKQAQLKGGLLINSAKTGQLDADGDPVFDPPKNITFINCNITSPVVLSGMGSAPDPVIRTASRRGNPAAYVKKIRANAPSGITINQSHIQHAGHQIYLSPGVNRFSLLNSVIEGSVESNGQALYLETETSGNFIMGNTFNVKTGFREQIAVDGSSNNTIVNNKFLSMAHGGIGLYRNCGEGGTVRITGPINNSITNNIFIYDNVAQATEHSGNNAGSLGSPFSLSQPTYSTAVMAGMRDGLPNWFRLYKWVLPADHCPLDAGLSYGSSISDYDHVRNNGIRDNQVVFRSGETFNNVGQLFALGLAQGNAAIKDLVPGFVFALDPLYWGSVSRQTASKEDPIVNSPNVFWNNVVVKTPVIKRSACFLPNKWGGGRYIGDGTATQLVHTAIGTPGCNGLIYHCSNGVISTTPSPNNQITSPSCQSTPVGFNCVGPKGGPCNKTVTCPAGKKMIGAYGGCNLQSMESIPLVISDLIQIPAGKGSTAGDHCWMGTQMIGIGAQYFTQSGASSMTYGCSGDKAKGCFISGAIYCQ